MLAKPTANERARRARPGAGVARRLRASALAWALALSATASCEEKRTTVVVVESDLDVPSVLASVHVEAGESTHDFVLTGPPSVPFSFGIEPVGGDASRIGALVVEGRDASGAAIVTRRARVGFVAGRTVVLHVRLDRACVGVECAASTTCVAHACIDDLVDVSTLPELVPGHELDAADAGERPDAGADSPPLGDAAVLPRSCVELPSVSVSGVYVLDVDGAGGAPSFEAYCDMDADGGGWALIAKVEPTSPALAFEQPAWTALEPSSAVGTNDTSAGDALLPSYWRLPVRELRIVMQDAAGTRLLVAPLESAEPITLRGAMEPGGSVGVTATLADWTTLAGVDPLVDATCVSSGAPLAGPVARVRVGVTASTAASCAPVMLWVGLGAQTVDQSGSCDGAAITAGSARLCGPGRGEHGAFTMLFAR